jgi:hypothetical protein
MGWHYILTFTCKVLPEYILFIEQEFLKKTEHHYYYAFKINEDGLYDSTDVSDEEDKNIIEEINKEICDEHGELAKKYSTLSKSYKDLIDIWIRLNINEYFYKYDISGDIFHCQISKKVHTHKGNLYNDYKIFLRDIIVPITSEITECNIESDDFGEFIDYFTDTELRNIPFELKHKIKTIEHTYSDDGSEIAETRVIYKHSIPKIQFLDLDRSYGFKQ